MRECWIKATKYGVALFPKRKKTGKKRRKRKIREWVNPRCSRPSINRSMSGMTEATNNRGMFKFTFRSLDVAFPVMYPKARCPTANVHCPSQSHCKCAIKCKTDYLNHNTCL